MLTGLLIKGFVREPDKTSDPLVRRRYGELAGGVGVFCNIGLFMVKLAVGIVTGSIAVMADAFNNLSDAGSSVVTLIGFRLSAKPADDEHPFGHGRIEYVAGLVVGVIIGAVGLDFLKGAVSRIIHPVEIDVSLGGVLLLGAAVPVKFWMFLFFKAIGRRIDSEVLRATAFDSFSDILTTSAVVLSLLWQISTGIPIDGYTGLIVAGVVVWGGIGVIRDTISPLIGEPPDASLVNEMERIMLGNPDICGVHDLIIHNYGPGRYFASAHAEVNSDCDPVAIHDSLERTETEVERTLPVKLTLHCDPFDRNDSNYKEWRLAAVTAAEAIDKRLKLYDFRMTNTRRYIHLRFSLLVPREFPRTNTELRRELELALRRRDHRVVISVTIDSAFV
ncbi:MAG: cation diffusion facilitator family transporter [Victivallaceae bacterium]|nr:cation diffusion facilitator family transporter [Victivallaceae bacterium]